MIGPPVFIAVHKHKRNIEIFKKGGFLLLTFCARLLFQLYLGLILEWNVDTSFASLYHSNFFHTDDTHSEHLRTNSD